MLAGAAARLFQGRLRLTGDFEASPGDRTFFRTGLMNYKKATGRARYKLSEELSLHAAFSVLDNRNDDPAIDLDFQSRRSSVTVSWAPDGGRLFTVLADYTRATVRSDILAVQLPFFGQDFARYRDNAHFAGAYVETNLPREVHLRLGGSLAVNAGSRPTKFYQPQVAVSAPVAERADWVSEWRWYGFAEQFLSTGGFSEAHVLDRSPFRTVSCGLEIAKSDIGVPRPAYYIFLMAASPLLRLSKPRSVALFGASLAGEHWRSTSPSFAEVRRYNSSSAALEPRDRITGEAATQRCAR